MKLAWATDIHLDHLKNLQAVGGFLSQIVEAAPEAVVLTGDISMAEYSGAELLRFHLNVIADCLTMPVYFVLGNHDYYGGSIQATRAMVRAVCQERPNLHYLTQSAPIQLTPDTMVLGHDGWYDMRLGQINPIRFIMTDWQLIGDYAMTAQRWGGHWDLDTDKILEISRALADEGVSWVRAMLAQAQGKNTLVLTHVPPFASTAKYKGDPSEPYALPMFTCKAMGDMLLEAAKDHGANVTVLAGHTHDPADEQVAENLRVKVGDATYGKPRFEILEVL